MIGRRIATRRKPWCATRRAKGANVVLLQELFDGDYFCIEQHANFLANAQELDRHRTVARFSALAKELGVVLPISVFERAGTAHYNTVVMADADGRQLGIYRKSHIPDGRGYQEKFYFSPGDTGFKVWDTAYGRIGSASAGTSGFPNAPAPWRCRAPNCCCIRPPSAPSRRPGL